MNNSVINWLARQKVLDAVDQIFSLIRRLCCLLRLIRVYDRKYMVWTRTGLIGICYYIM